MSAEAKAPASKQALLRDAKLFIELYEQLSPGTLKAMAVAEADD